MLRVVAAVLLSVGFGLAVAGCYAFVFAVRLIGTEDRVNVQGFGALNGAWDAAEYAFLGAALSSVGCALFVFGLTWFVALGRAGAAGASARRPLLWAVLGAIVVGGLGVGGASLCGKRQPPVLSADERARVLDVAYQYVDTGARSLATDEFDRRLEARQEHLSYRGLYSLSLQPVSPDEARVSGSMRARQQIIRRGGPFGAVEKVANYAEPRTVGLSLRLKKTPQGTWLVDDLEYKE